MGIRKQTHHNKIMTREVLQQVEAMRIEGMTYPQIAATLGIKESTLMNAAYEHNICERSRVYKAAFCDKWDFTGMDYTGAM